MYRCRGMLSLFCGAKLMKLSGNNCIKRKILRFLCTALSFRLWTASLSKKLVRKRNIYKIVHFKGYCPPIPFQTCPYFLRSTSDPIRPWIIGLVSDLYRRRVGGGTELGYVYCGNILDYRMLWMLLRSFFVRKSELVGFFM